MCVLGNEPDFFNSRLFGNHSSYQAKKRGLEAFRAFSCVFYISTSNVVQFGSITLTLKELLPPWQIRRPHPCIDVMLCCQKSESAKGGPFALLSFWLKIDQSLKIKCSQKLSMSCCCPTQGQFKTCFGIFITLHFFYL